jgi:hypothetical protein
MFGLSGKFNLVLTMAVAAIVATACGSAEGPTTEEDITITSLAVPEATPTELATLSPEVQAASPLPTPTTELPTEIIEPVSPISPTTSEEVPMPNPDSQVMPLSPGSEKAVAAATADLARQQGLPFDTITVQSVEPMDWSDASLGCPQEGFMYAQVITPGYLIILEAQGQTYEYHTDEQGTNVVLCEQ